LQAATTIAINCPFPAVSPRQAQSYFALIPYALHRFCPLSSKPWSGLVGSGWVLAVPLLIHPP
jgi:hypothetical protein